jgi:hypothetical protein
MSHRKTRTQRKLRQDLQDKQDWEEGGALSVIGYWLLESLALMIQQQHPAPYTLSFLRFSLSSIEHPVSSISLFSTNNQILLILRARRNFMKSLGKSC